jgi:tripartite-type tricarboxylate transporter receptor subunit TctC
VTKVPYVLSARPNFPGNNVQDLIHYAKQNPGKATYASAGVGSTIQLYAVELAQRTGTNMVHVPYRGAAPALTDVMAGHVDFLFDVIATSLPVWKDGKVKVLGVGSETRSPSMPDIPTIAEQGLPGFTAITWFAIVGPPNMPKALVDKINRDVTDILRKPEVVARYGKLLMEPMIASPAETQKFFNDEAERWGKLMKSAGISAIE